MLELSKIRKELSVVNDQFGNPTCTCELVKMIYEIIDKGLYGVCHATGKESVTWYDFAKLIFDIAKMDIKVNSVDSETFPSITKRPKYSILSSLFDFA